MCIRDRTNTLGGTLWVDASGSIGSRFRLLPEKTIPTTDTIQNKRKVISSKSIGIHQNTGKIEQNGVYQWFFLLFVRKLLVCPKRYWYAKFCSLFWRHPVVGGGRRPLEGGGCHRAARSVVVVVCVAVEEPESAQH
eukprot:6182535-Amphidinium_carterae.1